MTTSPVPSLPLLHGPALPQLGFGTWPMGDDEAEQTVAQAIQVGYRLFDTAHFYRNEEGVGRALRASGLPREELFVTTKLSGSSHGYDEAQRAFAASARRLDLEYVDLYLIHWPQPWQDLYVEAWRGLAKLLADGRVRAIGVSNFKPAHIDHLLAETAVVPDVNQIELNPFVTRETARAYHQSHGIVTQSWSPIALGGQLLREPTITEIAARHGKTAAQVVLRWHIELGLSAVPKSVNPERIATNIEIFDFALSSEEVSAISALDRGEHSAEDSDQTGN